MFEFPDLANARILVTNDDGYNARGIKILEKVAKSLTKDVWVVAPETEQSGAGHSLTVNNPLRLRKISARKFAVQGTPTDCVMLAVNNVLADKRPDLILSGINRGANMGEDVTYSGTVAACMEGALLQIPSIALSQSVGDSNANQFKSAAHHCGTVIKRLTQAGWPKDVLININFPDLPPDKVKGLEIAAQGVWGFSTLHIEERTDARERDYFWIGLRPANAKPKRKTDIGATEAGYIAVTPLQLDLTSHRGLKFLKSSINTDLSP